MAKGAKRLGPRVEVKLPVYTSMGLCEQGTGLPVAFQRWAKAKGCPAFRYQRVYLQSLLEWMGENVFVGGKPLPADQMMLELDLNGGSARTHLEGWKAKRERLRYMKESKRSLDKEEVLQAIRESMSEMFTELDRAILSDLPPRMAGLDELSIRKAGKEMLESCKGRLRARLRQLEEQAEEAAKQAAIAEGRYEDADDRGEDDDQDTGSED